MSMVHRFIDQLKQRGLAIEGPRQGDPDDMLRLVGPAVERTPRVMKAVKIFKPQLLAIYGRKAQPDIDTSPRPDAIALPEVQPAGE